MSDEPESGAHPPTRRSFGGTSGIRLRFALARQDRAVLPSPLGFDVGKPEAILECADMSALSKAATCRRSPKAELRRGRIVHPAVAAVAGLRPVFNTAVRRRRGFVGALGVVSNLAEWNSAIQQNAILRYGHGESTRQAGGDFGVRGHVRAFKSGDMSPQSKGGAARGSMSEAKENI